ncbi:MAG: SGNH/GDSL hydrolase family protein, partial [Chloroflexota bacterium]
RPYYRKSMAIEDGFVSPDTFLSTYRNLISELLVNQIEVYIGLPPVEANPIAAAAMREYNDIARTVARAHNAPVLDLYRAFVTRDIPPRRNINTRFIQLIAERERSGWDDWYGEQAAHGYEYTFDGVHWTPKAAEKAADLIVDFMGLR